MDNLQDKGPQDRNRISLTERWELEWWSKSLGVSEEKLRELVQRVGNSAEKVREQLKNGSGNRR